MLPDTRGLEPGIQQHQFTTADRLNRLLRVVRPEGTEGEGVTVHQETSVYASRLDAGVTVKHECGAGRGGYLYLIDGQANVNGSPLSTGDAAYLRDAGYLRVRTEAPTELLLVDTVL